MQLKIFNTNILTLITLLLYNALIKSDICSRVKNNARTLKCWVDLISLKMLLNPHVKYIFVLSIFFLKEAQLMLLTLFF